MRKRLKKKKLKRSCNPIDVLQYIASKVAKRHGLGIDVKSFIRAKSSYATMDDLKGY